MHVSMQKMVLIAKVVSTRLLNFVGSKLVIHKNGKVNCKRVLSQNHFKIHSSFYVVKNIFIKTKLLSFSPNEFLLQNLVLWVSRFGPKHFPKVFFAKTFP